MGLWGGVGWPRPSLGFSFSQAEKYSKAFLNNLELPCIEYSKTSWNIETMNNETNKNS